MLYGVPTTLLLEQNIVAMENILIFYLLKLILFFV